MEKSTPGINWFFCEEIRIIKLQGSNVGHMEIKGLTVLKEPNQVLRMPMVVVPLVIPIRQESFVVSSKWGPLAFSILVTT